MEHALARAIDKVGGQNAFARLHETSAARVNYWLRKKGRIPAEFVLKTEAATGVPRYELRPDIYPPV